MNIKTRDAKARDIKTKVPCGSKIKASDIKSKSLTLRNGKTLTVTNRKLKDAVGGLKSTDRISKGGTVYSKRTSESRTISSPQKDRSRKELIKRKLLNRQVAGRAETRIKNEAREVSSKEGRYPESESTYATNRYSEGMRGTAVRSYAVAKTSGRKIYESGRSHKIKERVINHEINTNNRAGSTINRSYSGPNERYIKNTTVNSRLPRASNSQYRNAVAEPITQAMGKARFIKQHQEKAFSKTPVPQRTAKAAKMTVSNITTSLKRMYESGKAMVNLLIAGGAVAISIIIICVMFGAAFNIFGDTSSSNYTPVSQEVEAYTSVITKYAKEHGIPEYVDLIKAVMMQESGGKGRDPMQCAESGYNVRYPREPNGITDPEYSIDIGVKTLAGVIKEAGVENPIDMDRIRLALQGYNYGNGYITWAIKRGGGYTVENAAIFSDEQASKHGWSGYGDKQYPSHVLRYYPYGNYNYGIGNTVIVSVAAEQIGNAGGKKFWSWYGFSSRVDWCCIFVSWCADQCGYLKTDTLPRFSVVSDGANWFKDRGQWQPGRSYTPMPGDIIFFDWGADGTQDHVGIIESCDGTYVYTIEGNTSDQCAKRQYSINSAEILGYGVPKY